MKCPYRKIVLKTETETQGTKTTVEFNECITDECPFYNRKLFPYVHTYKDECERANAEMAVKK